MRKVQRDLTSGEVARALKLSMNSVYKLIDSGALKGYRVPGSGTFRRVPVTVLEDFCKRNGIPYELDNKGR